jgi:hypothetical protein
MPSLVQPLTECQSSKRVLHCFRRCNFKATCKTRAQAKKLMRLKQDLAILPPSRAPPFPPFARRSTAASIVLLFLPSLHRCACTTGGCQHWACILYSLDSFPFRDGSTCTAATRSRRALAASPAVSSPCPSPCPHRVPHRVLAASMPLPCLDT